MVRIMASRVAASSCAAVQERRELPRPRLDLAVLLTFFADCNLDSFDCVRNAGQFVPRKGREDVQNDVQRELPLHVVLPCLRRQPPEQPVA